MGLHSIIRRIVQTILTVQSAACVIALMADSNLTTTQFGLLSGVFMASATVVVFMEHSAMEGGNQQ